MCVCEMRVCVRDVNDHAAHACSAYACVIAAYRVFSLFMVISVLCCRTTQMSNLHNFNKEDTITIGGAHPYLTSYSSSDRLAVVFLYFRTL